VQIKYRIGVMPGPWPPGPDGRDFFWRFVDLCEKSEIDSVWFSERLSSPALVAERLEEYIAGGGSKFILRPMAPPERMLDQLAQLATEVIPAFHRRDA
jgi:hypothetical protein